MRPHDDTSFEFERRFFVDRLPPEVAEHGSKQAILQAYLFAEDGYAVRIRLDIAAGHLEFPKFQEEVDYLGAYERKVLRDLLAQIGNSDEDRVKATMAVKSPPVSAGRYEMETPIDVDVAVQILRRCPWIIVKNRYSLWVDEDGWEFDVFGGQNEGLIIAECERLQPVVDLKIPDFCVTEVTEDLRFTNDYLSKKPWGQWGQMYLIELAARGPHFMNLNSDY